MNHTKSFLKNLFALQKKLGESNAAFALITGKHHGTLKNWKVGRTKPTNDDIAHVCKNLSRELAGRNQFVGFITKGSNDIRSFVTEYVEKTTFKTKKVYC